MQSPRYRTFLRTLFSAVLRSDLNAGELKALAEELRRGQLADELAYMLDEVSPHFRDPSREISNELRSLERLLKDKKVSKATLYNLLVSVNSGSLSPSSNSVRQMLQDFLSSASQRQVERLRGIIDATGNEDPYLKGISEQNR